MSSNVPNNVPFLRTSRNFPVEIQELTVEIDRAYLDIANAVNARTIGIYSTNASVTTGNSWFINSNQRNQTIRKIYTFSAAGNIAHGINLSQIAGIVKIEGTFTDGTNWYPLPYVDVTAANNQVNVIVNPTNIVITAGGGSPPTITSGFVIVEWLALV